MAKKILVNRKTGKEFHTLDADRLLKKYPRTFYVKPGVELDPEVLAKAEEIAESLNHDDIKNIADVDFEEVKPLDELSRIELNEIAEQKGLSPRKFKTKSALIKAINNI